MNGFNFTERTRKILAFAREQATGRQHAYVAPEHILLGLIEEGEGVGSIVLQNLNVDTEHVAHSLAAHLAKGLEPIVTGADLPYTSRAKKVMELAMAESRELNHSYVGSEHLLLGLLLAEGSIAAKVLGDFGVTLDGARMETLRVLGVNIPRAASTRAFTPNAGVSALKIEVRFADGTVQRAEFDGVTNAMAFLHAL